MDLGQAATLAAFAPMLLVMGGALLAARRQAALLEGVQIGLDAAANELSMQSCCCLFDVKALDAATVLARHGGA